MGDVVRILIADDHPLTRDGIKAALAMDPGLKVVAEATDGQEAVSLAASERPDVVLMDVRMPRLGGGGGGGGGGAPPPRPRRSCASCQVPGW
jgi:DNA-binding NarL/FixJ family response regulator